MQLLAKNMAATHVHAFAYAFAYAIKQTPYAFVAKIILCMYLLYDHSLVYLCRKISIPKEPPRIILTRQFKNYQASLFKQELSYYLSSYVTSDDPNVLWNNFKTNFLAIAQKHAPFRQRRVKHEHKP